MQALLLSQSSAQDIASSLRQNALLPCAIARQVISAHERCEPALRAWSWFQPSQIDTAYGQLSLDQNRPLLGVPVGVKDVIDVAGMPTGLGMAGSGPDLVARDATCVAMLRAAGAVPVGKTVTAEHAFSHPGPTRNPHALDRTPGGSSSGSAAAVAAGVVPLALGTQTGGSVIRPAAYCGVVGVKTSLGAVPLDGVAAVAGSLDCLGWFARSVQDAAAAAHVLLTGPAAAAPARWRIMLLTADQLGPLETQARRALYAAASALRNAGHEVVSATMDARLNALARCHRQIMLHELARSLAPLVQRRPHDLSTVLRSAIADGLAIDAAMHRQALERVAVERSAFEDALTGFDFVLTPSAAGPATTGLASTGDSTFNRVWSVLGWPAVHLPTAWTGDGLPLGVQMVGRHGGDGALLAIAAQAHPLLDVRGRLGGA